MNYFKVIIASLICLTYQVCLCQNQKRIDSLLNKVIEYDREKANEVSSKEIVGIQDSVKVKLYLEIAGEFWDVDALKNIEYSQKALRLAERIKFWYGKGNSYRSMGIAYENLRNYDSAKLVYLLALRTFEEIGYIKGQAAAYGDLANLSYWNGKYFDVLEYNIESIRLNTLIDNQVGIASSLLNESIIYRMYGDFDKSLKHIDSAIEKYIYLNDQIELAKCYLAKGNTYREWIKEFNSQNSNEFYDSAINYYDKAKRVFSMVGNRLNVAICLDNIGICLNGKGEKEKAIEKLEIALGIKKELPIPNRIDESYIHLAAIFIEVKNFVTAENYIRLAELTIIDQGVSNSSKYELAMLNGKLNKVMGRFSNALSFFKRGYDFSVGYADSLKEMESLFELADIYDSLKNFEQSNKYLRMYLNLKEIIYNIQNSNRILYFVYKNKYYEKKNKELENLVKIKVDKEKKDADEKEKEFIFLLKLSLSIISILILVIYICTQFFFKYISTLIDNIVQFRKRKRVYKAITHSIKTIVIMGLFIVCELFNLMSHHLFGNWISIVLIAVAFHVIYNFISKKIDMLFDPNRNGKSNQNKKGTSQKGKGPKQNPTEKKDD